MNLPTLIFVAVAIPFTVVAIVWMLAQSMGWLAPRPKPRGWMFGSLGLLYLVVSIWEIVVQGGQTGLGLALQIVQGLAGLTLIVVGVHEYRHGASVPLE